MEIKNDTNEQEYILLTIDNQIKIITELSNDLEIDTNCLNSLIKFRKEVDENWSFNNENYLHIVKIICQSLSKYLTNDKVIEFLLNFSKISCEVRDVYLENGLKSNIAIFLSKNKFQTNDYNQVLINDFLFDYYYNLAKDELKLGGIDSLSKFLKNFPDSHKEIAITVLYSMKNSLFITNEEFTKLKPQLKFN